MVESTSARGYVLIESLSYSESARFCLGCQNGLNGLIGVELNGTTRTLPNFSVSNQLKLSFLAAQLASLEKTHLITTYLTAT